MQNFSGRRDETCQVIDRGISEEGRRMLDDEIRDGVWMFNRKFGGFLGDFVLGEWERKAGRTGRIRELRRMPD